MYDNTEAKLSQSVSISGDAKEAVRAMAKAWDTDLDHAADRMIMVAAGRLAALGKYNKAVKAESREKEKKAKARKAAKTKAPKAETASA
jgi:hypothetical protein